MRNPHAELTAMLIDDSRSIREVLAAMLQNQGVGRVLQAEDGVSAFQALEASERPVDLLFCDLAMPGVDGVETLRGLATRRIEAGVVLLSGLDPKLMATVADMAEQLGCGYSAHCASRSARRRSRRCSIATGACVSRRGDGRR